MTATTDREFTLTAQRVTAQRVTLSDPTGTAVTVTLTRAEVVNLLLAMEDVEALVEHAATLA